MNSISTTKDIFSPKGGGSELFGLESFQNPRYQGQWGASDEDVFELAHQDLLTHKQDDPPRLSFVLTGSNHAPYQVPPYLREQFPHLPEHGIEGTFQYADWALGNFIKKARESEYFNRTVFVILSDHGEPVDPLDQSVKRYHVLFLILAPGRVPSPRVVSQIGGQIDVAPTLIHFLQMNVPFHFMGTSLLDSSRSGFAIFRDPENLWLLTDQGLLKRGLQEHSSLENSAVLYMPPKNGYLQPESVREEPEVLNELNDWMESYVRTVFRVFQRGEHSL